MLPATPRALAEDFTEKKPVIFDSWLCMAAVADGVYLYVFRRQIRPPSILHFL
jgi:hypothetical protein